MNIRILLADDDESLRRVLQFKLRQQGYEIDIAEDGNRAFQQLQKNKYDLLLSDVRMPGLDGIQLLEKTKQAQPEIEVILITAHATIPAAVEAVKMGAFDFLTKPFEDDQLFITIEKALKFRKLEIENRLLKEQLNGADRHKNLIGTSKPFKDLLALVDKVAPSDATVLLSGESGTGKEMIAHAIHYKSPRAGGPFVAVNCAAIPRELIESELFGHVKGAFTGAIKDKRGKFELAGGGTLLMDEVSELGIDLQAKLLRVIQERVIEPVGSEKAIEVDIRFIAATNVDLKQRVSEGKFREDLFYRLNIIPIRLPSLRERSEDIPVLLREFLNRLSSGQNIEIDNHLMDRLREYSWPGNIRELENLVERMVILKKSNLLTLEDLPPDFGSAGPSQIPVSGRTGDLTFHEAEKKLIIDALDKFGWNKSRAAEHLQIPRHILIYRMKRYGIFGKKGATPQEG